MLFHRYFERDVKCIQIFFKKRFGYESEFYPKFSDIENIHTFNKELECFRFTEKMDKTMKIEFGLNDDECPTEEIEDHNDEDTVDNNGGVVINSPEYAHLINDKKLSIQETVVSKPQENMKDGNDQEIMVDEIPSTSSKSVNLEKVMVVGVTLQKLDVLVDQLTTLNSVISTHLKNEVNAHVLKQNENHTEDINSVLVDEIEDLHISNEVNTNSFWEHCPQDVGDVIDNDYEEFLTTSTINSYSPTVNSHSSNMLEDVKRGVCLNAKRKSKSKTRKRGIVKGEASAKTRLRRENDNTIKQSEGIWG